jgi:ribonuclease E
VRLFLSKAISGGLSAGVVLLWWPLLFPADTLASWFVRGAVWTVLFELLLLAVGPLETALWETSRGERLVTRARVAQARLRSGSPRRTLARLTAMAAAAVAVPAALLAAGLAEGTPSKEEPRQVRVVEVTRVVRPVVKRVKRVVSVAPAVPQATVPQAPQAPAPQPEQRTAPVQREEVKRRAAPQSEAPAATPEAPAPESAEPEAGAESEQPPAATGSSI